MSKKCVIEKYLYQSVRSVSFVEVKKEDFFMIADLALKQLAIPKMETTATKQVIKQFHCSVCGEGYYKPTSSNPCPCCGRRS